MCGRGINILCTCAAVPTIKDGAKTVSKKASPKKPTPRKVGKPTSKRVVQTLKKVGATPKKVVQKKITPKKRGPKGGTPRKKVTPRRLAPTTNKARGKVCGTTLILVYARITQLCLCNYRKASSLGDERYFSKLNGFTPQCTLHIMHIARGLAVWNLAYLDLPRLSIIYNNYE